jgi:tRNA(Ile)-lysidine synthase
MAATEPLRLPPLPAAAGEGAVVAAFSGGVDSTVLLHLLAGDATVRSHGLRALHVHHGLQADADDWAEHCTRACAALDVPLQVVRVEVDAGSGLGPEGAARAARHAAFAAQLAPGEVLALAHHQDDQAETFLLRALRASGADGLGAMRPLRSFGSGLLWRPLLDVPRARLLQFACDAGLAWREDPSNACSDADRNHLRLHVLPALRDRWPHAAAAFARSAALSAEAAGLLEAEDAAALAAATGPCAGTLAVDVLHALPRARRARVLRRWLHAADLPPLPARGIEAIENDLLAAAGAGDGQAAFAWQGARVQRWRGLLHAGPEGLPLAPDFRTTWSGQGQCLLPTGDALALVRRAGSQAGSAAPVDPATGPGAPPWTVRARLGGERIVLPGRRHSHALKHVLQDLGVPPWDRIRLPLLVDSHDAVLAAGDVAVSAALADWLDHVGMQLAWQRDPRPAARAGGDHGAHAGLP